MKIVARVENGADCGSGRRSCAGPCPSAREISSGIQALSSAELRINYTYSPELQLFAQQRNLACSLNGNEKAAAANALLRRPSSPGAVFADCAFSFRRFRCCRSEERRV